MAIFPKKLNLVNRDFESGLSGWSRINFTTVSISAAVYSLPENGTTAARQQAQSALSRLWQNVAIPTSAYAAIDSGNVKINVSFVGTKESIYSSQIAKPDREYALSDGVRIATRLVFYDSSSTEITSAKSSEFNLPISVAFLSSNVSFYTENQIPSYDAWTTREFVVQVPAGTRSVDVMVEIYMTVTDVAFYYIDKIDAALYQQPNTDVVFRLSEAEIEALVQEIQTPQSRFTFAGLEVISSVEEEPPPQLPTFIVQGNVLVRGNVIIGKIS